MSPRNHGNILIWLLLGIQSPRAPKHQRNLPFKTSFFSFTATLSHPFSYLLVNVGEKNADSGVNSIHLPRNGWQEATLHKPQWLCLSWPGIFQSTPREKLWRAAATSFQTTQNVDLRADPRCPRTWIESMRRHWRRGGRRARMQRRDSHPARGAVTSAHREGKIKHVWPTTATSLTAQGSRTRLRACFRRQIHFCFSLTLKINVRLKVHQMRHRLHSYSASFSLLLDHLCRWKA